MQNDRQKTKKELIRLEIISMLRSRSSHAGVWKSVFKDGGHDIVNIREFTPGDPLRKVHWPTFLKTEELYVREDYASRLVKVFLCIDTSSSAVRCFDIINTAVMLLVFAAQYWSAPVGAFLFDEEVHSPVPLSYDRGQLDIILDSLRAAQNGLRKRATNFTEPLLYLRRVPVRSLIFWISDFLGVERKQGEFARLLGSFNRRYDITPIIVDCSVPWRVIDPRFVWCAVEDAESDSSGNILLTPDMIARVRRAHEARIKELRSIFDRGGSPCAILETDDPELCARELTRCFTEKIKRRR